MLAFVDAVTGNGYRPLVSEVEAWLAYPEPREAQYHWEKVEESEAGSLMGTPMFDPLAGLSETINRIIRTNILPPDFMQAFSYMARTAGGGSGRRRVQTSPAETLIEHLTRIGWLRCHGADGETRVELSALGRALLRHVSAAGREEDLQVVMLDRDDPVAYPLLVGYLAELGTGLLVDPYLKVRNFQDLTQHTKVNRVLMRNDGTQVKEFATISLLAAAADSPIEVRASERLHDRYFIPSEGTARSIGTSLNGVGRKYATVFSTVPAEAEAAVREYHQALWEAAAPVEPGTDDVDDEPS